MAQAAARPHRRLRRRVPAVVCAGAMAGSILFSPPASATPDLQLSVVAGNGDFSSPTAGPALSSALADPQNVAFDASGDMFIADASNDEVEEVTTAGVLSVIAGTGSTGDPALGPATSSDLSFPSGVAVDGAGNVYIADQGNDVIEKVTPGGTLSIVAGNGLAGVPVPGPATSSPVYSPSDVAVDASGDLYIADQGNNVIDEVTPAGTLSVVAGDGAAGAPTPGPATASRLDDPSGLTVDASGDLYIADYFNNYVEKVTPGGTLSIIGGDGTEVDAQPGPATSTSINSPSGVAVDGAGDVFVAVSGSSQVVEITPDGQLQLVAGLADDFDTQVPGPAIDSPLDTPTGVAFDPAGRLYVADSGNNVIEQIAPPTPTAPGTPTLSLGWATVGSPASGMVTSTGWPAPTYAVTAGALPPGLGLDPTTGSVSGTPSAAGSYPFTVTATNASGSAGQVFTVYVAPEPTPPPPPPPPPPGPLSTAFDAADQAGGGVAATPTDGGYWSLNPAGRLGAHGNAPNLGSVTDSATRVVGVTSTRDGRGYWEVSSTGGVFSYGDAGFLGSLGAVKLNQPIVAMDRTPDGGGYWLVAADGGVFSFGDARFQGSLGDIELNQPIVAMSVTPDGRGYWLTAADGGVFCFGDARFFGSTGASPLNKHVVSMTIDGTGRGYWLTAADGGIFSFGDAPFFGSQGARGIPTTGMVANGSAGYRLIDTSGGAADFGTNPPLG